MGKQSFSFDSNDRFPSLDIRVNEGFNTSKVWAIVWYETDFEKKKKKKSLILIDRISNEV